MNNKKNFIFFLILILLVNCSFDNKTGIWSGDQNERKRIIELEQDQIRREKNIVRIVSSENIYSEEKVLAQKISLSEPKKNLSWKMSNLNHQNLLGNIYLSGIENNFLKKKLEKINFHYQKLQTHH